MSQRIFNRDGVVIYPTRKSKPAKDQGALDGSDDEIEARAVQMRAALRRIKRTAERQYAKRAPAGSDLLDQIAAVATDALNKEES
jgi:hypothetical protein